MKSIHVKRAITIIMVLATIYLSIVNLGKNNAGVYTLWVLTAINVVLHIYEVRTAKK